MEERSKVGDPTSSSPLSSQQKVDCFQEWEEDDLSQEIEESSCLLRFYLHLSRFVWESACVK